MKNLTTWSDEVKELFSRARKGIHCQRGLVSQVEPAVGDSRIAADNTRQQLCLRLWSIGAGSGRRYDSFTIFANDEQPVACKRHRARTVAVDAPLHLARF